MRTNNFENKKMRQTNTKKQQQIEWRRNKINELSVKGYSQSEIVKNVRY